MRLTSGECGVRRLPSHLAARNTQMKSLKKVVPAIAVPFLLMSGYLFFSRWPEPWFTGGSDYAAIGVSVIVGLAFIASLQVQMMYRAILALLYVPALCGALFIYAFWFVGTLFGDWL